MNSVYISPLKILRKIYAIFFGKVDSQTRESENDPDKAAQLIYNALTGDLPIMIARFGSNELNVMINYLSIKSNKKSLKNYITGKQFDWWWNKGIIKNFNEVAGFFPIDTDSLKRFSELMIKDITNVDILGSWLTNERKFENEMKVDKVHIRLLEPFWSKVPWTKALDGKKVLVIHPFTQTIKRQYENRKNIFKNANILPDFHELILIKSIQSSGNGDSNKFKNWFEALEYMKAEIDKVDYDICLIGAGAYGFPLAAHVKRTGKKAVHLGGALQLLFGIKGKRWEDPNYGVKAWGIAKGSYTNLMNEHWVRPDNNERPKNPEIVEGACYW